MFVLHPRLHADTIGLGQWPLSFVQLMDEATYPWLILVPARPDVSELHDLSVEDQRQLMTEITSASSALARALSPDKINVAAIGNLVPQLHVHVIARFRSDPAWPAPVWGKSERVPYTADALAAVRRQIVEALGPSLRPIAARRAG